MGVDGIGSGCGKAGVAPFIDGIGKDGDFDGGTERRREAGEDAGGGEHDDAGAGERRERGEGEVLEIGVGDDEEFAVAAADQEGAKEERFQFAQSRRGAGLGSGDAAASLGERFPRVGSEGLFEGVEELRDGAFERGGTG
jgi:hypothetical protein